MIRNTIPIPTSNDTAELGRVVKRIIEAIDGNATPSVGRVTQAPNLAQINGGGTAQGVSVSATTTFHWEVMMDANGVVIDTDGNTTLALVSIKEIA